MDEETILSKLNDKLDDFLLFKIFEKSRWSTILLFLLLILYKSAEYPGWIKWIKKEKYITFFDISNFNVN